MEYRIKMTSKGQITLPKDIREQLMLKFGDYLQAQVKDGSIIIKPYRENDGMLLMEYAEQYGARSKGIEKVRELTSGLNLSTAEYVRRAREENR